MTLVFAFLAGAAVSLITSLTFASYVCKLAARKEKYASAVWCNKNQRWEVTGSYLMIAGKIHQAIKEQNGKVRYKSID